jgi:nitrate reductase NapE component
VPKLDGRFDAAVWARIESASATASVPAARSRSGASRWLFLSNVIGVVVAIVLVGFFGVQSLTGVEVNVALPQVSPGMVERVVTAMIWPVTAIAISFGMMFTPFGRRLRSEFF